MKIDNIIEFIKYNKLGTIKENEPASNHCSVKVGGTLSAVYFPDNTYNLIEVLKECKKNNYKYKILGRGSNLIFENKVFETLFIKISNVIDNLSIVNENIIKVGAGYSFQKLAKILSKEGFSGLEFAGGIPGTVGGAIFMNAGAHVGEIKDIISEVTFLDEEFNIRTITNKECLFSYRDSIFQKKPYIIIEAKLVMFKNDKAEVLKKMLGNLEYRKEMQPLDYPSFGSVFKNPQNYHVGKLIEQEGLKGYKIGGAIISNKHANFILNEGNATANDIMELISYIQEKIRDKYSLELHTEVEIIKE